MSHAIASLHTTLVALGFVAVGLAGDRIVGRLGRRRAFWAATAGAGRGRGRPRCRHGASRIGLLYPVTIALALASVAGRSDAASARAALGSGVAIAFAPFVLASLADGVGLVLAYGMVPALLLGGWLASLVAIRARAEA